MLFGHPRRTQNHQSESNYMQKTKSLLNALVQQAFGTPAGLADRFGSQSDPTGLTRIHPRTDWVPRAGELRQMI